MPNECNRPLINLSRLLRGITSNNIGELYCLNHFHLYRTELKDKIKRHQRLCQKHDYFHVKVPTEENKIFKCNHRENS